MNRRDLLRQKSKNSAAHSAKECAYLAVFVGLVIAMQLVLSFVPGVELVTVTFVAYAFVMGAKRGVFAATVFAFMRQLVFGVYPVVLVLYLVYFNLLALCFGALGRKIRNPLKFLPLLVFIACVCTVCFTMLDNVLTPLWLGFTARNARLYFYASLPVLLPQTICTAVSVAILFLPLHKAFSIVKRTL